MPAKQRAKGQGRDGRPGRRPDPAVAAPAGGTGDDGAMDRAAHLPGRQLNDPEETAAAGVHTQPIFPQRRGGGPR